MRMLEGWTISGSSPLVERTSQIQNRLGFTPRSARGIYPGCDVFTGGHLGSLIKKSIFLTCSNILSPPLFVPSDATGRRGYLLPLDAWLHVIIAFMQ